MGFLSKKGISPLIATVLLIGFTVALAGVVITWGGGFIKNITTGTEERTDVTLACTSDLNFDILKVNCATSEITLDNKGSVKLEAVKLRLFDANGDTVDFADDKTKFQVAPFAILKQQANDGTNALPIPAGTTRVEAVATIKVGGEDYTCSEALRFKEFTPAC